MAIPAGQTQVVASVPTVDDEVDEDDETVTATVVERSPALGLGTGTATGTITDGDAAPLASVADATVAEGEAARLAVTLDHASAATLRIGFAAAPGSATAADFESLTGTLTFAPGETVQTLSVPTTQDTLNEDDETFTVTLSDASDGLGLGDSTATVTITDDNDAPPVPAVAGPASVRAPGAWAATVDGQQAGASLECALRTAGAAAPAFGACPAGLAFSGLAAGSYVLEVRQVDRRGRTSPAVATAFEVVVTTLNPGTPRIELTCTKVPVMLFDVSRISGGKVRVAGLADVRRFAGKTVQVKTSSGVLGSVTVAPDGTFTVTARSKATSGFTATFATGEKSASLRLDRHLS